jgi:hypothetical protein
MGKVLPNYELYGHRQVSATECPGEQLYQLMQDWPGWVSTSTKVQISTNYPLFNIFRLLAVHKVIVNFNIDKEVKYIYEHEFCTKFVS